MNELIRIIALEVKNQTGVNFRITHNTPQWVQVKFYDPYREYQSVFVEIAYTDHKMTVEFYGPKQFFQTRVSGNICEQGFVQSIIERIISNVKSTCIHRSAS